MRNSLGSRYVSLFLCGILIIICIFPLSFRIIAAASRRLPPFLPHAQLTQTERTHTQLTHTQLVHTQLVH